MDEAADLNHTTVSAQSTCTAELSELVGPHSLIREGSLDDWTDGVRGERSLGQYQGLGG